MLDAIKSRLNQGSTHAGLAAIAGAVRFFVPVAYVPVFDAAMALFGAVAVALNS